MKYRNQAWEGEQWSIGIRHGKGSNEVKGSDIGSAPMQYMEQAWVGEQWSIEIRHRRGVKKYMNQAWEGEQWGIGIRHRKNCSYNNDVCPMYPSLPRVKEVKTRTLAKVIFEFYSV